MPECFSANANGLWQKSLINVISDTFRANAQNSCRLKFRDWFKALHVKILVGKDLVGMVLCLGLEFIHFA